MNPEHDIPFEKKQQFITLEYQIIFDNILNLLREQIVEIYVLHERIHELENDRIIIFLIHPSSPTLFIGSNPFDSFDSSDLFDSFNGSDKSASSTRSGRFNFSSKTHTRDLKVIFLDLFYDKTLKFQNFVMQYSFILIICSNIYNSNQKRVLFVILNLRNIFFSWIYKIIFNKEHFLHKNYIIFIITLINIYNNHVYELKYENRLNRLI